MTNLEFFKEELAKMTKTIAIVDGKPESCTNTTNCDTCDRHNKCNDVGLLQWLLSEHIEETDNSKICKTLKVDDKILVSDNGNFWEKRHFAKYDSEGDYVVAFDSGATSWSVKNDTWVSHWKYVKLPEEEGEAE